MFTVQERQIFAYVREDGITRYADPLKVRSVLVKATRGDFDKIMRERYDLFHADRELLPAEEVLFEDLDIRLSEAMAQALELTLLNHATGEGVTQGQLLDYLAEYSEFMQKKTMNSDTTQMSEVPCQGCP